MILNGYVADPNRIPLRLWISTVYRYVTREATGDVIALYEQTFDCDTIEEIEDLFRRAKELIDAQMAGRPAPHQPEPRKDRPKRKPPQPTAEELALLRDPLSFFETVQDAPVVDPPLRPYGVMDEPLAHDAPTVR